MKKRLLSIALALSLIAPVCATPTAEAYSEGRIEKPVVLSVSSDQSGLVTGDGTLWMWGDNADLQVGDETNRYCWSPIKVLTDVKTAAMGGDISAAVKKDGSLWIWGTVDGISDYEDNNGFSAKPIKLMENVSDVVARGFGGGFNILKEDGSLWELPGTGKAKKILDHVCSIDANGNTYAAIKTDGSLWMWGEQIKYPDEYMFLSHESPVKVMDNVKSVSIGSMKSGMIKKDGSLWVCEDFPVGWKNPIKMMDDVAAISVGGTSAAIKTDGSLWMWGSNYYGQIGDGTEEDRDVPIKVMDGVVSISNNGYTLAAIKTDGSLWMWGDNQYGQIGDGTVNNCSVPKKILDSIENVLVYDQRTAAIKQDGTVWVWGNAEGLGLPEDFKGYKTYYESYGWYVAEIKYVDVPTQLMVPTAKPQCTITLNLSGGQGVTKITCDKNGTITPPNNPSRDGYFFAGWYKDKACKKPWNFDTDKVTGNCTLYAKWEPKSTTTVTAEPSTQKVEIDGKKIILNSYVLRNEKAIP